MNVLIVEDEKTLSQLIQMNLDLEGYTTDLAVDGAEALDKINSAHYDIVILDLMLPKISGMDVLSKIRLQHTDLPVIITSAKDTSSDRIQGLKEGADDYLVKPFEMEELLIRMQKLLSRIQPHTVTEIESYEFGNNKINFSTFAATNGQETFELSSKECLIMKFLISKKGQVVSRQDLLKNVWGYNVFPSTRTIDNFISNLRKRFETDIKNPKHILSVRGVGYKFVDD